jgi:hypothetical protein
MQCTHPALQSRHNPTTPEKILSVKNTWRFLSTFIQKFSIKCSLTLSRVLKRRSSGEHSTLLFDI